MSLTLLHLRNNANNSRMLLNVPGNTGYLNYAKTWVFVIDPNNATSDGYPAGSGPANNQWSANPSFFPTNYFGDLVWKWDNTGAMQMQGVSPIVIKSSTVNGVSSKIVIESTGAVGDAPPGNLTLSQNGSLGLTSPRLQFAFGWNIQSISDSGISNGAGGTFIQINCKTNYCSQSITGRTVNVTGTNANTTANDLWSIVKIDNQTFYLNVSQTTGLPSSFQNAQAAALGTAILPPSAITAAMWYSPISNWSGLSNLVVCELADESKIAAGFIWKDEFVASFKASLGGSGRANNPGFLRFMDISGVQSSYDADFSQRMPPTYCFYPTNRYCPGYWTGTITNGGSDNYTCSDPSVSVLSSGSYIDNAVVQGKLSAGNSGVAPSLAVGTGPAKPIINTFDYGPASFFFSGPPTTPGTDVLQFTFSASWLNGGTPYVFSYTTVSGDTSVGALNGHLVSALSADTTLSAAKVYFTNSGKIVVRPRTAQAGRLTVTYTSGPAICTIGTVSAAQMGTGSKTFIYNALLDAWIWLPVFGGLFQCIPYEAVVELCNRVGAHCYYTFPLHTKVANLAAMGDFFSRNLNPNLKLAGETGNEPWNSFGGTPYGQLQQFATALALDSDLTGAILSYVGLRTIQYGAIIRAAWVAAGRLAKDFIACSMAQDTAQGIGGAFDTRQMLGTKLLGSNSVYTTYGAMGLGPETDHTTAGTRPGDFTDATGLAPYWANKWFNYSANGTSNTNFDTSQGVTGTVIENAPILQAAMDFTNGNTALAFTELANTFNGTTTRSSGSSGGLSITSLAGIFASQEAEIAQFDAARASMSLPKMMVIHYEGGNQWAMGANFNNGVNAPSCKAADISSFCSADVTNLANKITGLGWDTSAYTGGTSNPTLMATMIIQLSLGWKYDTDLNGAPVNTGSYKTVIKTLYYAALVTAHPGREVHPGQYSYQSGQWGFFWSSWDQAAAPYQSETAAAEWNS